MAPSSAIAIAYPYDQPNPPWRIYSDLLLELVIREGEWLVVHLVRP